MRPLELTWYPMTCNQLGEIKYQLPHDGVHLEQAYEDAEAKRFTDAELAAEYWQSLSDYYLHGYTEAVTFIAAECDTWNRFATHPHYSDAA